MNCTSVYTTHINRMHTHTRTLHFIYYIDSCTDILYTSCTDGLYFCVHYCKNSCIDKQAPGWIFINIPCLINGEKIADGDIPAQYSQSLSSLTVPAIGPPPSSLVQSGQFWSNSLLLVLPRPSPCPPSWLVHTKSQVQFCTCHCCWKIRINLWLAKLR